MIKLNSLEDNANGNSKKQLAPKTEIDALLDSMTQETANVHNSNSSSLNVYSNNNTQPFDDPIIQKMFENRVEMTDIAPEFELIRRQRMHNLLRYSKKYQKLQVAEANKNWDSSVEMFYSDVDMINSMLFNNAADVKVLRSKKSVKFNDITLTNAEQLENACEQKEQKDFEQIQLKKNELQEGHIAYFHHIDESARLKSKKTTPIYIKLKKILQNIKTKSSPEISTVSLENIFAFSIIEEPISMILQGTARQSETTTASAQQECTMVTNSIVNMYMSSLNDSTGYHNQLHSKKISPGIEKSCVYSDNSTASNLNAFKIPAKKKLGFKVWKRVKG